MLKQRIVIATVLFVCGSLFAMAPKGLIESDHGEKSSIRTTHKVQSFGKISFPRERRADAKRKRVVVRIRRGAIRYIVPTIMINRTAFKARISHVRRGRTYISLDGNTIEKLGLRVVRDRRKGVQSVYLVKGDLILHFTAGRSTYRVNGQNRAIRGRSPYFYRGKLMVPFRSIAENLQLTITWDNTSKEINVFA